MKYLKAFFGGLIGIIGVITSGLIIYTYFSEGDSSNMVVLIVTLPMIFGLKPLFSMFSAASVSAAKNMVYIKKFKEAFKSDQKTLMALSKLSMTSTSTEEKSNLFHEKIDFLIEIKDLDCTDEVITFLVTAENLDIQKLIQKAKASIQSMNEIENSFRESEMDIDFGLWEDSSWKNAIPADEYDEDSEPSQLNERYWKNCYGDFEHNYWNKFQLHFSEIGPNDIKDLQDICDIKVDLTKDKMEEKSRYFNKYSEFLAEEDKKYAEIKDRWGESIYLGIRNRYLVIGMPMELCERILGPSYEEKETRTADSVSLNCKFGESKAPRGGSVYSHHLWFEEGLMTKFKTL